MINGYGLGGLPPELLHEIVGHLPILPFPLTPRPFPSSYPFLHTPIPCHDPRIQRMPTLRALSQTCRSLRKFARPLAWECIEVVSVRSEAVEQARMLRGITPKAQRRHLEYPEQLARDLWRQLRLVLGEDDLRKNLRRISVILTKSSTHAALELFKALPTFPKLHTIQLLSLSGGTTRPWEEDFSSALSNYVTPLRSVRNVVLPNYAHVLLQHCPNLEVAVATLEPYSDRSVGRTMLGEIFRSCPSTKLLQGFPMVWPEDVENVTKYCPQTTHMCIDDGFSYYLNRVAQDDTFVRLYDLKYLQHITLVVHASGPFKIPEEQKNWITRSILLLGNVRFQDVELSEDHSTENPFTSPFPKALLPVWFLQRIMTSEGGYTSSETSPEAVDLRTLTVDIAGIKRPVAIFTIVPPSKGESWPRLLRMQFGYRSDDAFEELYDLVDIPLRLDQQPDPLTNEALAKPQGFLYQTRRDVIWSDEEASGSSSADESDILSS